MPQVTLEYSSNIKEKDQIPSVMKKIHEILSETLPTYINTCKSRAFECDTFLVGDGNPEHAFIHCTLKILANRPKGIRLKVAQQVLTFLKEAFRDTLQSLRLQITVELTELSEFYYKVASDSP